MNIVLTEVFVLFSVDYGCIGKKRVCMSGPCGTQELDKMQEEKISIFSPQYSYMFYRVLIVSIAATKITNLLHAKTKIAQELQLQQLQP